MIFGGFHCGLQIMIIGVLKKQANENIGAHKIVNK